MRPGKLRRLLAAVAAGAVLAGTGVAFAGHAEAQPAGAACQTDLWGFLGTQRRTLCDGPVRGDGSWERLRVIWTPAYTTPINCYGRYYFNCWGGDFVGEHVNSSERYPVTPSTVLPDEPQHLVRAA